MPQTCEGTPRTLRVHIRTFLPRKFLHVHVHVGWCARRRPSPPARWQLSAPSARVAAGNRRAPRRPLAARVRVCGVTPSSGSQGEMVEQLGRDDLRHEHIRERRVAISFGACSSRPNGRGWLRSRSEETKEGCRASKKRGVMDKGGTPSYCVMSRRGAGDRAACAIPSARSRFARDTSRWGAPAQRARRSLPMSV